MAQHFVHDLASWKPSLGGIIEGFTFGSIGAGSPTTAAEGRLTNFVHTTDVANGLSLIGNNRAGSIVWIDTASRLTRFRTLY